MPTRIKFFTLGLILICPSPFLWGLSQSLGFIVILQFMSGMAWACYEVGLALIFFRELKKEEKVPLLTVYNMISAAGIIVGTALGGKLLMMLGMTKSGYLTVFVVGGLIRLTMALSMIRVIHLWQKKRPVIELEKAA